MLPFAITMLLSIHAVKQINFLISAPVVYHSFEHSDVPGIEVRLHDHTLTQEQTLNLNLKTGYL